MSRLRFRYTWVNIEGEELDDTKRALSFHNVNRCAWDDVFRIANICPALTLSGCWLSRR